MSKISEWIRGRLNVVVIGNLVICKNEIYSYQLKIGEMYRKAGGDYDFSLLDSDCSPSSTTTKHINLVRSTATSMGIPVSIKTDF